MQPNVVRNLAWIYAVMFFILGSLSHIPWINDEHGVMVPVRTHEDVGQFAVPGRGNGHDPAAHCPARRRRLNDDCRTLEGEQRRSIHQPHEPVDL